MCIAWYFINLLSIFGIILCARLDKGLTIQKGRQVVQKSEYDNWIEYYDGRRKIYQIICATAIIPIVNNLTMIVTVLGLFVWFFYLVLIKNVEKIMNKWF
jgi:hypothetical protein